jgi:Fic family protein
MKRQIQGHYETISYGSESVSSFVPNPLPPVPKLHISNELQRKMNEAMLALGRLDSITLLLPDTNYFLYLYIRKEAVLSSQIEGTQSSLSDLLLFEMDGIPSVPLNDVKEILNYVNALNYGIQRLKEGFPFSIRLIKELHAKLLSSGRGSEKEPGEFRTSPNWIGGTRPGNALYVPPPPHKVLDCMGDLEKFVHGQPEQTDTLIKLALTHAQFETIHPFLDGNGRLGRMLITLLLCEEKILCEPLLYLSLYFKQNRQTYYDMLQRVRTEGTWEEWIGFFVDAIKSTAAQAVETARALSSLIETDNKHIQGMGRIAGSAARVHTVLCKTPFIMSSTASSQTKLTPSTVNKALKALIKEGIVSEVTNKKRNRLFVYKKYIDIINDGMENYK